MMAVLSYADVKGVVKNLFTPIGIADTVPCIYRMIIIADIPIVQTKSPTPAYPNIAVNTTDRIAYKSNSIFLLLLFLWVV